MKNIKKYFHFALLSIGVLVGTTTQASFRKISRIAAAKTQKALNTVKSNISALQAGAAATALAATGAAATSGINLPAIASAAASIDPSIAAFGAGIAAGANFIGSLQTCNLYEFKQHELAAQKAIVSPKMTQSSKKQEFINILLPKTPSQLKKIADKENNYWMNYIVKGTAGVSNDLETADQISKNHIKNNLLPVAVVSYAPIYAGILIAGEAFLDGATCGMGSALGYSCYSLFSQYKQYTLDQAALEKANTKPETAFNLIREHQMADQILESTNDKTLQFFTRDISTPTDQK